MTRLSESKTRSGASRGKRRVFASRVQGDSRVIAAKEMRPASKVNLCCGIRMALGPGLRRDDDR